MKLGLLGCCIFVYLTAFGAKTPGPFRPRTCEFRLIEGGGQVNPSSLSYLTKQKEDELKILKEAVGKSKSIIFVSYDSQFFPTPHVGRVISLNFDSFGILQVTVAEKIQDVEMAQTYSFPQIEIFSDTVLPPIHWEGTTPVTMDDLEGYHGGWKDLFVTLEKALKENLWLEAGTLRAKVRAIDRDPRGYLTVALAQVNGGEYSMAVPMFALEGGRLLDSFDEPRKTKPLPLVQRPLPPSEFQLDEVFSLELMTEERQKLVRDLIQAQVKQLTIEFNEGGKRHHGQVAAVKIDPSGIPIITLTDLEGRNPIFRTIKGIHGFAFSKEASTSSNLFATSQSTRFDVKTEVPEDLVPALTFLRTAVYSGSLVSWLIDGLHFSTGRISQVFEEESEEILVVIEKGLGEPFVSTLAGLLWKGDHVQIAEAISKRTVTVFPSFVSYEQLPISNHPRVRILTHTREGLHRYETNGEIDQVALLQKAAITGKAIDFRSEKDGKFERARVLQVDSFYGITVVLQLEANNELRIYRTPLFDLRLAVGAAPPQVPTHKLDLKVVGPNQERITITASQRSDFDRDVLPRVAILEKAIRAGKPIRFTDGMGNVRRAEIVELRAVERTFLINRRHKSRFVPQVVLINEDMQRELREVSIMKDINF